MSICCWLLGCWTANNGKYFEQWSKGYEQESFTSARNYFQISFFPREKKVLPHPRAFSVVTRSTVLAHQLFHTSFAQSADAVSAWVPSFRLPISMYSTWSKTVWSRLDCSVSWCTIMQRALADSWQSNWGHSKQGNIIPWNHCGCRKCSHWHWDGNQSGLLYNGIESVSWCSIETGEW